MALQQILSQKDESDCYEGNHAVWCPPVCKYKFPPEIAQLQKWPWTNCSCVTALRNANAHAHKCSVWRFFLKCIKKPTFIAHSMMMEMYLLEVSFGWWDKNTTQRWIICLPKRPLIHIWMSRLKFGLRRKIGQLFSEMNLCDSIYLLFSACGVALLIELPLYNSHEILLAKN